MSRDAWAIRISRGACSHPFHSTRARPRALGASLDDTLRAVGSEDASDETLRLRHRSLSNKLDPVGATSESRLTQFLAAPPRAAGDWSIVVKPHCECRVCATLQRFLGDKAARILNWPLPERDRRHVDFTLDPRRLPVARTTRREGRPHTLVLTKTTELFTREAADRARWRELVAELSKPPRA